MRLVPLLLAALLASCSHDFVASKGNPRAQAAQVEDRTPSDLAGKLAVVYFEGTVTDKSVDAIIGFIEKVNELRMGAIVISIDSPGGYVQAGIKLTHAMERSSVPVFCVVDGQADSMAFYILQACRTRLMTRRSLLMVHEPSTTGEGNLHDMRAIVEQLQALTNSMAQFESARLNISRAELERRIRNREWWMQPAEALRVGAVDAVVESEAELLTSLRASLR